MNLSTPVSIPESEKIISQSSSMFLIGSCFSDNIGKKLLDHNFKTCTNPFGTVFNPISVSKLLDIARSDAQFYDAGIANHDNRYFHYDFHSSMDGKNREELISNINSASEIAQGALKITDVLVITFGSSIVYKHLELDKIVSNCHKVPGTSFERQVLTTEYMKASIAQSLKQMQEKNPNLHIVLTVSPVRHTKEGLIDNSLSKSRLIDLCHQLQDEVKNTTYFPSYEIMMDELRDYRYYNTDLIHPTELAVDIIWERFQNQYFQDDAITKINDFSKLNKAVQHRPFDHESDGHKQFCKIQLEKISALEGKYTDVDFRKYRGAFSLPK